MGRFIHSVALRRNDSGRSWIFLMGDTTFAHMMRRSLTVITAGLGDKDIAL